ncbi:MAG: YgfZ/GcvT domain-containing protein [Acidimicrobiales bacterium]
MTTPTPPADALDLAATEAGMADGVVAVPARRDVVSITGADAVDYLQGQLSQNVAALRPGDSTPTFVLHPQGKVAGWGRLTATTDGFVYDVEPGHGDAVAERLERFKLRVDVTVTVVARPMLGVRGPGAAGGPDPIGIAVPEGAVVVPAPRTAAPAGFDVLGLTDPVGSLAAWAAAVAGPVPIGDSEGLVLDRIRAGGPAMGAELTADTIPAAAGVVAESVDFTKGCYVGQELVARIDARGAATPTRLRIVTAAPGAAPFRVGQTVVVDGAEVGTLTTVATSPAAGPLALAYVRRSVEPPATAAVDGTVVTVDPVPVAPASPAGL